MKFGLQAVDLRDGIASRRSKLTGFPSSERYIFGKASTINGEFAPSGTFRLSHASGQRSEQAACRQAALE